MKNLSQAYLSLFLVAILASCNTQHKVVENNTRQLLKNENFAFIAEEVNHDGFHYTLEGPNWAGNSWENLPNFREEKRFLRSTSQRLDPGYSITVAKNELEVTLPVFDRFVNKWTNPSSTIQYTSMDDHLIQFTATNFTVDQKINKKGKTTLTIIAKDINNPIKIKMEVFESRKTYVEIDYGIRKSSSYGGYLTKNITAKN